MFPTGCKKGKNKYLPSNLFLILMDKGKASPMYIFDYTRKGNPQKGEKFENYINCQVFNQKLDRLAEQID
jgi:hypothetical protein